MVLQLGSKSLRNRDNPLGHEEEACFHYSLEEGSNPEDKLKCGFCETTRLQRLEDVVEQTVNTYTASYPCLVKCGHVVPYAYGRCPFC